MATIAPRKSDLFLFDEPLPSPVEGETLFSWVARYQRVSGTSQDRDTSHRLFGNANAALRHDFPTHIDNLVENIGRTLGNANELIATRTLVPYFAPFLSPEVCERVVTNMRCGERSNIRNLLGISASRLGHDTPLKACPGCVHEDLKSRDYSVWYRAHQWPTTWVCLTHGNLLQVVAQDFLARGRKRLCLPHEVEATNWRTTPNLSESARSELERLGRWTERLVKAPAGTFSSRSLRYTYALSAKARGYLAMDGSLRLQSLCKDFLGHYAALLQLPELSFLTTIGGNSGGFIGSLTRRFDGLHHPAKHLFLAMFLFEAWEQFMAVHRTVSSALRGGKEDELVHIRQEPQHTLAAMVSEGMSVNAAASSLGLPTAQAVRYLKANGIEYQRRSRIVGTEIEHTLITLLQQGASRSDIAETLDIRRAFVKDYLAQRPTLKAAWEAAHFEQERNAHRRRFQEVLATYPSLPIKWIRRLPGNGFQWLYNNDREWLKEQLPAIWTRPVP